MLSPVKVWRNQKYVARMVGKVGVIVSWNITRVPPADFMHQAPYPVVLVDLEGGGRIVSQLVDWDQSQLTIGQRVITVIRKVVEPATDDVISYGIKVKPIRKA